MTNKKLIIGGIRCESRPPESKWLRRYTGDWEILFILEGTLQISYHGKELSLSADRRQMVIYSPGFAYHFRGCRGTKYIFVHLRLREEIESVIKLAGIIEGLESFSLPAPLHRRIKRDMLEITELIKRHSYKYDLAASALAEAVILRLTESDTSAGADSLKLSKAFTMLTRPQNLSMEEIAAGCGLSISAFYQKFKQETGCTPRMYRENFKIQEAARMLLETDWTLNEIAAEVNMYDQYYLSKRFRKFYGMPPSTFRQMHRTVQSGSSQ